MLPGFAAKIEFLDGDNNTYTIPVSGTTDNSVLTVFPYLMQAQEFFVLEGNPIQLRETVRQFLPLRNLSLSGWPVGGWPASPDPDHQRPRTHTPTPTPTPNSLPPFPPYIPMCMSLSPRASCNF